MNTYSYSFFVVEFQKDNSKINELYEKVISTTPQTYSSFAEYSQIIKFFVTKYVQYNDYLHSNNLLQAFRIFCNENYVILDDYDWYKYYSVKIYSRRSIKYYLDNPHIFWENIYSLANTEYLDRLDSLLVSTLEFYKKEYISYPEFLQKSITKFVEYYFENKPYSDSITHHLRELKQLISTNDREKVNNIYNNLQSQNINYVELPEDLPTGSTLYKIKEAEKAKSKEIEEDYYGDICLSEADSDKKIMIIGDDPFMHKAAIIYGIAKEFNITKGQLEIYNDYNKIKQEGERIINKTQYRTDKYIGIIFGSNPHLTSGNEGYSSLISKVESEPGFPYVVVCKPDGVNGKLKITKTNFVQALREIIIDYKSR